MNRIDKLLPLNIENNIKLILIQINEAHSSEWPKYLVDQPDPQKDFNERLHRAKSFIDKYSIDKYPFIEVYVDGWDDKADNLLQLWPDKYYLLDNDKIIIKNSEYGLKGDNEAKIVEDYLDILKNLLK